MPSKEELNLMYVNLYQQGLEGFSDSYYSYYWSSSEVDGNGSKAESLYFKNGNQYYYDHNESLYVRAIRAF